jgi:hypothetical protein
MLASRREDLRGTRPNAPVVGPEDRDAERQAARQALKEPRGAGSR